MWNAEVEKQKSGAVDKQQVTVTILPIAEKSFPHSAFPLPTSLS
jgi:hypothetical protein